MTPTNTFVIEFDEDHNRWITYVWLVGIHDGGDPQLALGTEETHNTIDEACRRIKAWKHVERLIERGALPAPKPEDIVLWEDFGEFHIETLEGQRTVYSLKSALTIGGVEAQIRKFTSN
jgi:hypothetical protein